MRPGTDRDIVLYALRYDMGRCAEIVEGGADTFQRIAHAAPNDTGPWSPSPRQLVRELQHAAADGDRTAEELVTSQAPESEVHHELSRRTQSSGSAAILRDTAFIVGFLSRFGPERFLSAMQYAATKADPSRLQYTSASFPPAIRSTAMGLATGGDEPERLASAARMVELGHFTLPDVRACLTSLATQDWSPNIRSLVWACPHPRDSEVSTEMAPYLLGHMIRNASNTAETTAFALLTDTATDPRRIEPDRTDLARYLAGLRGVQLGYAMYSVGNRPRQLLITDWPELAERVTSGQRSGRRSRGPTDSGTRERLSRASRVERASK